MIIPFEKFSGIFPRYSDYQLPDNGASVAQDCDFVAGTLRGLRGNDPQLISASGVVSMFIYNGGLSSGRTFLWSEDTDAVRSPVVDDTYSRFYWTNNSNGFRVSMGDVGGNGPPSAGGGNGNFLVGVPRPSAALTNNAQTHPIQFTIEGVTGYEFTLFDERADGRIEFEVTPGVSFTKTATSVVYTFRERSPQEEYGYVPDSPDQMVTGYSLLGSFPIADSELQATSGSGVPVRVYAQGTNAYTAAATNSPMYAYYDAEDVQPSQINITVHAEVEVIIRGGDGGTTKELKYTTKPFYQLAKNGSRTFWYSNQSALAAPTDTNEGVEVSPFTGPLLRIRMTRTDGAVLEAKIRSDAKDTVWPSELPGYTVTLVHKAAENLPFYSDYTLTIGVESSYVEVRAYTYTYVNIWGEEGPPADPFTVTCVPSASVTLGFTSPPGGYAPINRIRVYRTGTGASAGYLYVGELNSNAAQYLSRLFTDVVKTAALGHTLDTTEYYPPEQDLRGVCVMANGIMAAFRGSEVHFSEPYLPYAWSPSNIKPLPSLIKGICPFEGGLFVTTVTQPYIINGAAPEYMTDMKINAYQAGVSKGSVVAAAGGVAYASNDGIVLCQGVNASLELSQRFFTREKWRELYGARLDKIRLSVHDGAIVVWFSDGTLGFLLRTDEIGPTLTTITTPIYAAFVHPLADALYISTGGTYLQAFSAATGTRKAFTWVSKIYTLERPTNFGVLQIFGTGSSGSGTVSYTVQDSAGVLVQGTVTVLPTGTAIRLPGGRLSSTWKLSLSDVSSDRTTQIHRAFLATTFGELQRV